MREYDAVIGPLDVKAGGTITLPGNPALQRLTYAEVLDTGNYPDASAVAPVQKQIVTTAPAAGQVQLSAPNQVTVGDDLNDGYQSLVVRGIYLGDIPIGAKSLGGQRNQ